MNLKSLKTSLGTTPGTLLVTSATAAVRGSAGQLSHASAMGGAFVFGVFGRESCGAKQIRAPGRIVDGESI